MCVRIVSSITAIIVVYIESRSKHTLINITLTLLYGLLTIAILIVSPLFIKYEDNGILSLIVQILCGYCAIAVSYTLSIISYGSNRVLRIIDLNYLAFATLFTLAIAVLLASVLKATDPEEWEKERSIMYIGFVGQLYFRALQLMILPLIFSTMMYAMSNIDSKISGRLGRRTFLYYVLTTVIAIVIGIVFMTTIKPGSKASNKKPQESENAVQSTTIDMILDMIRNAFPDNIIGACFQAYVTILIPPANESETDITDIMDWTMISEDRRGRVNMVGILLFSLTVGLVIGKMDEQSGKPLKQFVNSFMGFVMKMLSGLIRLTPIAVLFMVISHVLTVDSLVNLFASLGWYVLTAVSAMLFHGLIVLPLLFYGLTRQNPYAFLGKMSAAAVTAFGTSSSAATLPVTMQCLEERCGVDRRIVRFVAPLGATINMDGTALCEATAAIFIAQYREIELSAAQIIIVSIIATTGSIGAPSIPSGGPGIFITVLVAVGLPVEDAVLLFIVEFIVDRVRTALNVMGDAFGAGVVYHLSRDELEIAKS